jgi:hypothetical protein
MWSIDQQDALERRIINHIERGPERERFALEGWYEHSPSYVVMVMRALLRYWIQSDHRPTYRYPHWRVPVKIGT